MNHSIKTQCLVVGAGIAGLSAALKLARSGRNVLLVAKGRIEESNTWYAQGGIASVLDPTDSFENHVRDTLVAGAGLCHESVVRLVVSNGPRLVEELVELGAQFDRQENSETWHLTKEGGHSHRRVIHSKDLTGREVARALIHQVRENKLITVLEGHVVIDLITTDKVAADFSQNLCVGAYIYDVKNSEVKTVQASHTFLCTGGHGKLYLYTSNPDSATGDGLAIGWRAGCKVANLEMMQFHPTCLFHPKAKNFLISEAVRGEGAVLRNLKGESFMDRYHPMGSLAPRDIVARAIDSELKKSGASHVILDIRPVGREKFSKQFPTIESMCTHYGIDIFEEGVPVVPAAHYSCGGIVTDMNGRTSVGNLYAVGEVACTGLHGANRLASNSLLEAMVFADRAVQDVLNAPHTETRTLEIPAWMQGDKSPVDERVMYP